MRKFHSDNQMLINTLKGLGINLTCNEKQEIIVSDEDADRIVNLVPAICPAAIGDYSIELLPGKYYAVQYDHPELYLRLDSFPPHTFRWQVVCRTLEEAKAVFEKELSMTHYKKIDELDFKPSDDEYMKNSFSLCIDGLTVDEDGDESYDTIEISKQEFYLE